MRILQVIATVEMPSAGPSYTVPSLGRALAACGHDVRQLSIGSVGERTVGCFTDRRVQRDFPDTWLHDMLWRSPAFAYAVMNEAPDADIVHGHGLWRRPSLYAAWSAQQAGRPFVLSPRGMLGPDALKFSLRAKQAFWALGQGRAARSAACIHATSEQEAEEVRAFGLTQPIAIIPNGVDMPEKGPQPQKAQPPFVLSLGRIHPKKGLDRLIAAWRKVNDDFPDWLLRVVGPNEAGYADALKAQVAQLGAKNVTFSDPVFGDEKAQLLASAELFVLPTLNENFAMTVAESLAAGTPVISTKGAPWAGLRQHRCGWWIDHGIEPLAATLGDALSLPSEERAAMGARGAEWMLRDYSWDAVAREMSSVYAWLKNGGPRPAKIRFN